MDNKKNRLNTSEGLIKAWREATGMNPAETRKEAHKEFLETLEAVKLKGKPDPVLAKWREASLFGKTYTAQIPQKGVRSDYPEETQTDTLFSDEEQG
jgi:hypothetical protein